MRRSAGLRFAPLRKARKLLETVKFLYNRIDELQEEISRLGVDESGHKDSGVKPWALVDSVL